MTHQQKLHLISESDRAQQEMARQPCAKIGYYLGVVGVSVIDRAGRIAMVNVDVAALDRLIAEAELARAMLLRYSSDECPKTERNDVVRGVT